MTRCGRAGGATARADLTQVNLAAKVEDGRQVSSRGGVGARRRRSRRRGAPAAPGVPLNLNTATLEQLDELAGRRPGDRPEDPRLPGGARRLRLRRGARPGRRASATCGSRRSATRCACERALADGAAARTRPRRPVRVPAPGSSRWSSGCLAAGWRSAPRSVPAVAAAPIAGRRRSRSRRGARGARAGRRCRGPAARTRSTAAGSRARAGAIVARAVLLEPVRERRGGPRGRRARGCSTGPAAGERAVLRAVPAAHAGAWPGGRARSSRVARHGRAARARSTRYQRRRGALAAVDVDAPARDRRAPRRRSLGASTRVRAARRAGLGARAAADRRRRCCAGMVLGQDEHARRATCATTSSAPGSRTCSRSAGQNVMLLATLVLGVGRARRASPLRARLLARARAGRALRAAHRRPARRSSARA